MQYKYVDKTAAKSSVVAAIKVSRVGERQLTLQHLPFYKGKQSLDDVKHIEIFLFQDFQLDLNGKYLTMRQIF